MKVPPANNCINGFDSYEEETYFTDGSPTHAPIQIQNGVEEFIPQADESDFSEYMWMENEEEFDKEVLQTLEEEELMEQCILQHMLENERSGPIQPSNPTDNETSATNSTKIDSLEMVKSSTLNPHAAEFVPSWGRATTDSKSS